AGLRERLSCFLNGSEILHGQSFRQECDSRCRCRNGSIRCVPYCPRHPPPLSSGCRDMRLVNVPGQCCKQWRCVEGSNRFLNWLKPQSDDIYPSPEGEMNPLTKDVGARRGSGRDHPGRGA
ncbi:hypothetical protein FKM82_027797, partial [Ascaphus truei]